MIRVRFRQRLRGYTKLLGVTGVAVAAGTMGLDLTVGAILLGIVPMIVIALWWQGARMAARVVGLFDSIAAEKRWVLCGRSSAANVSRFLLKPADATSCAPASEPA